MLLFIFVFKEIILKLKKTKSFFFKTKLIKIYIVNKYLSLANNNDNKFSLQFVSIKLFFIKSLCLFILYNLVYYKLKFCWFRVLRDL